MLRLNRADEARGRARPVAQKRVSTFGVLTAILLCFVTTVTVVNVTTLVFILFTSHGGGQKTTVRPAPRSVCASVVRADDYKE